MLGLCAQHHLLCPEILAARALGENVAPPEQPIARTRKARLAGIDSRFAAATHLGNTGSIELEYSDGIWVCTRWGATTAPFEIADEPLASLDPGHQIDVMELLRAEADTGKLVIAVLHDLTMAARYCDRLVVIDRGTILADGTPRDVLTPELLRAVYGIDARIETGGDWPTVTTFGRAQPPD